eukprot:93139-Pleurochrysis_carterae.AAC.4
MLFLSALRRLLLKGRRRLVENHRLDRVFRGEEVGEVGGDSGVGEGDGVEAAPSRDGGVGREELPPLVWRKRSHRLAVPQRRAAREDEREVAAREELQPALLVLHHHRHQQRHVAAAGRHSAAAAGRRSAAAAGVCRSRGGSAAVVAAARRYCGGVFGVSACGSVGHPGVVRQAAAAACTVCGGRLCRHGGRAAAVDDVDLRAPRETPEHVVAKPNLARHEAEARMGRAVAAQGHARRALRRRRRFRSAGAALG